MKIGYPCINTSIGCRSSSTFRLASYSEERLVQTVSSNLECLQKTLEYNKQNGLLFFRITSDLVPFASHPVCKFDWAKHFKKQFKQTGLFIKKNKMRVSMHPDQFVVINSPKADVVKRSVAELVYHARVLDSLGLDSTAKIQLHLGGVYGDKPAALERFAKAYKKLPAAVKKRLVIENDDRSYSLANCLGASERLGFPVLFDSFHHECLNNGESFKQAVELAANTWEKKDGILMVDYSSQKKGGRKCSHTHHIDLRLFEKFIKQTRPLDFDVMLEIKDKEASALKARRALEQMGLS